MGQGRGEKCAIPRKKASFMYIGRSVVRCISHRKCFQVIHQIIQDLKCDKPDVCQLIIFTRLQI